MPIREIGKNEAEDSTRWLEQKENTEILNESLDLSLSPVECERSAGTFAADLIGQTGEKKYVTARPPFRRLCGHLGHRGQSCGDGVLGHPYRRRRSLRLGRVNRIVPSAQRLPTAREWAVKIGDTIALGIRRAKEAMIRGSDMAVEDRLRLELGFFEEMPHSEDFREGLQAKAEERKEEV